MNRFDSQLPQVQPPDNRVNWFSQHHLWGYAFLVLAFLLAVAFIYQMQYRAPEEAQVCIEVITPARNPETGEVRDFPTPCDVPEGWVQLTQVLDQGMGKIRGSLSYPGEAIPPMTVCAEDLLTKEKHCVPTVYNQAEYELTVPTGKYYVYAENTRFGKPVYYSEFVVCGTSIDCPSHAPIIVEVNSGSIREDVDPGDYYY